MTSLSPVELKPLKDLEQQLLTGNLSRIGSRVVREAVLMALQSFLKEQEKQQAYFKTIRDKEEGYIHEEDE